MISRDFLDDAFEDGVADNIVKSSFVEASEEIQRIFSFSTAKEVHCRLKKLIKEREHQHPHSCEDHEVCALVSILYLD